VKHDHTAAQYNINPRETKNGGGGLKNQAQVKPNTVSVGKKAGNNRRRHESLEARRGQEKKKGGGKILKNAPADSNGDKGDPERRDDKVGHQKKGVHGGKREHK